jgi:replicative DNA helicase
MAKLKANYQCAADVADGWKESVLTNQAPVLYPVGKGDLAQLEIGPGLVTLIGGAPGAGKTALTMQLVIDALRLTDTLRVLVCNIEMPPTVLLDRQLARLSGVDLTTIRYRKLESRHAERIDLALSTLEPLAERLCFVRPPFDLANVAASADEFNAKLILLDYIQRIPPPGEQENRRGSVDSTMNFLRQFSDHGIAVIVVSALGRSKDSRGRNSYEGKDLNLASFRESSELEFGCDDAFILTQKSKSDKDTILLKHLKARYGEARDITLLFDRPYQRFNSDEDRPVEANAVDSKKISEKLTSLWDHTQPAGQDAGGKENGS